MAVFTHPQWTWRRDAGPRQFAFVSNAVEVAPVRGRPYVAYVVVPAELFQALDALLDDHDQQQARARGVTLYLDQLDATYWAFGFEVGDRVQDLWLYTNSTRPKWALP